jgi:hypothetical protein
MAAHRAAGILIGFAIVGFDDWGSRLGNFISET